MTARAEPAPAIDPIRELTTQFGTGFLPLVIRSMLHPLLIPTAIGAGWPVTNAQASASFSIGLESISTASVADAKKILGPDAALAIDAWKTALAASVTELEALNQDEPASENTKRLTFKIYPHAFILLSILDEDLLGLTSDGGTTP